MISFMLDIPSSLVVYESNLSVLSNGPISLEWLSFPLFLLLRVDKYSLKREF